MKKYRNTKEIKAEGSSIVPGTIWEQDSDGDYSAWGYTPYLPASYVEETDHFEEIKGPETLEDKKERFVDWLANEATFNEELKLFYIPEYAIVAQKAAEIFGTNKYENT